MKPRPRPQGSRFHSSLILSLTKTNSPPPFIRTSTKSVSWLSFISTKTLFHLSPSPHCDPCPQPTPSQYLINYIPQSYTSAKRHTIPPLTATTKAFYTRKPASPSPSHTPCSLTHFSTTQLPPKRMCRPTLTLCICGTVLRKTYDDCTTYRSGFECGYTLKDIVRVTDLDTLCWHCQFARFRWPTKDGNERGCGGIEHARNC